jgi:uncharacterized protein
VYSASKIAREEFPNYDVTVRGSISMGDDCQILWLNWLKLIQAIGVGHQHDVDQTKLKEELIRP